MALAAGPFSALVLWGCIARARVVALVTARAYRRFSAHVAEALCCANLCTPWTPIGTHTLGWAKLQGNLGSDGPFVAEVPAISPARRCICLVPKSRASFHTPPPSLILHPSTSHTPFSSPRRLRPPTVPLARNISHTCRRAPSAHASPPMTPLSRRRAQARLVPRLLALVAVWACAAAHDHTGHYDPSLLHPDHTRSLQGVIQPSHRACGTAHVGGHDPPATPPEPAPCCCHRAAGDAPCELRGTSGGVSLRRSAGVHDHWRAAAPPPEQAYHVATPSPTPSPSPDSDLQDHVLHTAIMAKAEALAYGKAQSAFGSSDGVRAAVAASAFPAGGVVMPMVFHGEGASERASGGEGMWECTARRCAAASAASAVSPPLAGRGAALEAPSAHPVPLIHSPRPPPARLPPCRSHHVPGLLEHLRPGDASRQRRHHLVPGGHPEPRLRPDRAQLLSAHHPALRKPHLGRRLLGRAGRHPGGGQPQPRRCRQHPRLRPRLLGRHPGVRRELCGGGGLAGRECRGGLDR